MLVSKLTVSVYCLISPPLIDKNQNFITLTMTKLKTYIKIVYIEIFEGTGVKIKAITNQEGFSYHFNVTGNSYSVKVCKTNTCHIHKDNFLHGVWDLKYCFTVLI